MEIEFEKKYLRELYNQGKCKNKKYRFTAAVVKKYQKRIDTLMGAPRIEDLYNFNSLNFESLEGSDAFSIRVDLHYRLIFKIKKVGDESILTVCVITDLSNHYK